MKSNNENGYARMGRPLPALPDIENMSNIVVIPDTVDSYDEEAKVVQWALDRYDTIYLVNKHQGNSGFPRDVDPTDKDGNHVMSGYYYTTRSPSPGGEATWQEAEPVETGMWKDVRWPDWLQGTSWHNSRTDGGAFATVLYRGKQEITDKVLTQIHDHVPPGTAVRLSGVTLPTYKK